MIRWKDIFCNKNKNCQTWRYNKTCAYNTSISVDRTCRNVNVRRIFVVSSIFSYCYLLFACTLHVSINLLHAYIYQIYIFDCFFLIYIHGYFQLILSRFTIIWNIYFSGTCCTPSTYLTIIDKNNNFVRCHFFLGYVIYIDDAKSVLSTAVSHGRILL